MSEAVEPLSGEDADRADQSETLAFPPHLAERALLAGLLLGDEHWPEIVELIDSDDFQSAKHTTIYQALVDMLERGEQPDVVSLLNELDKREQADKVGGKETIADLLESFPPEFNTHSYARIVRDRSTLRKLRRCALDIAEHSKKPEGREAETVLAEAQAAFFNLWQDRSGQGNKTILIKDAVGEARTRYEQLSSGESPGIKSKLADLDEMLQGGFNQGDLVVVAGRPSTGKTALALNLAQAAVQQDHAVLMFSLEMPSISIAQRLTIMEARIDGRKLLSGKLNNPEKAKVEKAMGTVSGYRFLIDDTPGLRIEHLASRARQAMRDHPDIGMIVVDYIQLVVGSNSENRTQEVSSVSRILKAVARELEVPMLALSQLSRDVEKSGRGERVRMPRMSDLRDSGAIEQDADQILFLYRPYVSKDDEDDQHAQSKVNLLVGKNRNGRTGQVALQFLKEHMVFKNYAEPPSDMQPGGGAGAPF